MRKFFILWVIPYYSYTHRTKRKLPEGVRAFEALQRAGNGQPHDPDEGQLRGLPDAQLHLAQAGRNRGPTVGAQFQDLLRRAGHNAPGAECPAGGQRHLRPAGHQYL